MGVTNLTPLFLNQTGELYPIATINARWSEIRNYMQYKLGSSFNHKPHNLRPTYAVKRLFSLNMRLFHQCNLPSEDDEKKYNNANKLKSQTGYLIYHQ